MSTKQKVFLGLPPFGAANSLSSKTIKICVLSTQSIFKAFTYYSLPHKQLVSYIKNVLNTNDDNVEYVEMSLLLTINDKNIRKRTFPSINFCGNNKY